MTRLNLSKDWFEEHVESDEVFEGTVRQTAWGLFDTVEECWIGNQEGPVLYEGEDFSKLFARIVESRMRWAPGRIKATIYDGSGDKKKDRLVPKISGEEAVQRLEEGLD